MQHISRWLLLALCLVTLPCRAEDTDAAERQARTAFKQGVYAFEQGRLTDALDLFQRAYAIKPAFRILFNIAQIQAEMGQPNLALETFELYLAEGGSELTQERRLAVEQEMQRLEALVSVLEIQGPSGATAWIDGQRKGRLPLAGPLTLPTGLHRLVLKDDLGRSCQRNTELVAGKATIFSCELAEGTVEPEPGVGKGLIDANLNLNAQRDGHTFLDKVAPWLASGLGAAALIGGTICAAKTVSSNNDLNAACKDGICDPNRRGDVDALPRLAAATDILFVASAVLTGVAVTLFIAPWRREARPRGVGPSGKKLDVPDDPYSASPALRFGGGAP